MGAFWVSAWAMKKETNERFATLLPSCPFAARLKIRLPLMVYLSACLTTVLLALALAGISDAPWGYIAAICVVLWATV